MVCIRTPCQENTYFLYLILKLFRSVRKTCSCSIVKLVPPDVRLRLKCMIKLDFRWGFAQTLLGSLQRSPRLPSAIFKGPTSEGREGEKGKGRKMEGEWKGTKRKGGENDPVPNFWLRH